MPSHYNSDLHKRRSIRLAGYDYAQAGAYFVTICTWDRACLFGSIVGGVLSLSTIGEIVEHEWLQTAAVRPAVTLDHFVVMPNHFHGILLLDGTTSTERATQRVAPTRGLVQPVPRLISGSLGAIVGQFKAVVTKRVNELRGALGAPVWQRGYHEHVIRNETEVDRIREYIAQNPTRWTDDRYHTP